MKNFNYNGKSNLTFTHEGTDYLVHGTGPHELPEDSPLVQTHVARGSLVLVEPETNKVANLKTETNGK